MKLDNWDTAYKVTIPLPFGGTRESVVFFQEQYIELFALLCGLENNEHIALCRIAELELKLNNAECLIAMNNAEITAKAARIEELKEYAREQNDKQIAEKNWRKELEIEVKRLQSVIDKLQEELAL
jgi:hypothetical protein